MSLEIPSFFIIDQNFQIKLNVQHLKKDMQYVTHNYPAMSYSFEFPWKILVNSILNSQKLLFVDGSSRDGLYVRDIGFFEKSFLGLQNNMSIFSTMITSAPLRDWRILFKDDSSIHLHSF